MRRPLSVTIIGGAYVAGVLGCAVALAAPLVASETFERVLEIVGLTHRAAAVWSSVGLVLSAVYAHGFLTGRAWVRGLYLLLSPVLIALRGVLHGVGVLETGLPLGNYAVIACLLVQPAAREFFRTGPHPIAPARGAGRPGLRTASRVRRWLSLPLFLIGEHLCFTYSLAGPGLARELGPAALGEVSLHLLLPGLACLAAALALWGWSRWRGVSGTILSILGVEGLSIGAFSMGLRFLPQEYLALLEEPLDLDLMARLGAILIVVGVVTLPPGIALILWQRARDRDAPGRIEGGGGAGAPPGEARRMQ